MIFSGKTDNQTELGTANRGIAGDAIKSINDLISTRGTIMTQSKGATARIGDYELKLNALNIRMEVPIGPLHQAVWHHGDHGGPVKRHA